MILERECEIYEISDFIDIFQYSRFQIQVVSIETKQSNRKTNQTNVISSANEVDELRKAVECFVSRTIKTPSDFYFLADMIRENTKKYISSTTLKRMWKYIKGYNSIRRSTLQILVQFLGFREWEDFLQWCSVKKKSKQGDSLPFVSIHSLNLMEGMLFELNFDVDQSVVVKYIGDDVYQVVKSFHSNWQAGDRFHSSHFVLNRQLVIKSLPTDEINNFQIK